MGHDRRPFLTLCALGKYATLRAHVMSPTLPSNHLPFPATHIADARRRRSPRHHYSSSSSLQSALTTQYTAELLTTTSEAPFPWLAVARRGPTGFSPVPHIRLASKSTSPLSPQGPSRRRHSLVLQAEASSHTHARRPKCPKEHGFAKSQSRFEKNGG